MWAALAQYPGDAADKARGAASAHDRLLVAYAVPLLEAVVAGGDVLAAERLGGHLPDLGEPDTGREVPVSAVEKHLRALRTRSEPASSTVYSDKRLHESMIRFGVHGGLIATLAPHAEAGDQLPNVGWLS